MTLLSVCRNVLAETGWPVLSTIASNTEITAQQIFAIANAELKSLSERYDWPHLETDYSFDTVVDQSVYAWPNDFRKVSVASLFDAAQYYNVKGSVPIDDWNARKHGLLGNLSRQVYRVNYAGGTPAIELTPTPADVRSVVALYYSTNYASDVSDVSVNQPEYTLDTDVSRVPERLVELGVKWRFRRAKGLDFSVELAEYNETVSQQFAARVAAGDITVGGTRNDYSGLTGGYVPSNGFG